MNLKFNIFLFFFLFASKGNLIGIELNNKLEPQISLCKKTIEILQKNIIEVMDNLYQNRNYWQEAQYRPFGYFVEKGPLKWFSGNNQWREIEENLEIINSALLYQASFLGYLYETQDELSKENLEVNKEKIEQITKKIQHFLLNGNQNFEYSLEDLLKKSQKYKNNILANLSAIQNPSHFQRYWHYYSIAALCTLGGYNYWGKNKKQIVEFCDETIKTGNHFFNHYIKGPIKNSIDIIYGKNKNGNDKIVPENPDEITDESENSEKIVDEIITERIEPLSAEYINFYKNNSMLSEEEITSKIKKVIANRKFPPDLQKRADEESRNLTYNILWYKGKILNLLYLKIGLLELMMYDRIKRTDRLVKRTDQIMEAHKLNFELLVALPATAIIGILGYLSYKIGNKLYHSFFSKPELYFQPLKEALVKLETILNAHQNIQSIDYAVQGQIFYWTQKLYNSRTTIPLVDRNSFELDLQELTCFDFTPSQKLSTIHRMFRAYPFLQPI
jgi:hypothetical protein